MTYVSLNRVVTRIESLFPEIMKGIEDEAQTFIRERGEDLNSCDNSLLLDKIRSAGSLFSDLKSHYKQEKLINDHFDIVHPKTLLLSICMMH